MMWSLFEHLLHPYKGLDDARAENQSAKKEVSDKMKNARNEGVTLRMSREALERLGKHYGDH